MLTLWDLIPVKPKRPPRPRPPARRPVEVKPTPRTRPATERYEAVARAMLAKYGIRVRKWRSNTSGVAWQVTYADGTVSRLIEAPRPRGPISVAVFLHEVGHHAIGLGTYKPRCLEEYHAWLFALQQMHAHGLNITPKVHERVDYALRYAVAKARRRGIKALPIELVPFDGRGPVCELPYLEDA
ncbi:MAG: hypothetical protein HRU13_04230 [Phycisphaerales bacterium]|nr:hypothetical protein [Phycisphaerales bacterium]